jgi:hypothetical protein
VSKQREARRERQHRTWPSGRMAGEVAGRSWGTDFGSDIFGCRYQIFPSSWKDAQPQGANWVSSPTYLAVIAVYLQPENSPEQHIVHSARIVLPAKWSSHANLVENQTQDTWFSYRPFLEKSNGSLYSSTVMLPETLNTTKDRPQLNLSLKGLGDSLSTIPDYYSELTRCW